MAPLYDVTPLIQALTGMKEQELANDPWYAGGSALIKGGYETPAIGNSFWGSFLPKVGMGLVGGYMRGVGERDVNKKIADIGQGFTNYISAPDAQAKQAIVQNNPALSNYSNVLAASDLAGSAYEQQQKARGNEPVDPLYAAQLEQTLGVKIPLNTPQKDLFKIVSELKKGDRLAQSIEGRKESIKLANDLLYGSPADAPDKTIPGGGQVEGVETPKEQVSIYDKNLIGKLNEKMAEYGLPTAFRKQAMKEGMEELGKVEKYKASLAILDDSLARLKKQASALSLMPYSNQQVIFDSENAKFRTTIMSLWKGSMSEPDMKGILDLFPKKLDDLDNLDIRVNSIKDVFKMVTGSTPVLNNYLGLNIYNDEQMRGEAPTSQGQISPSNIKKQKIDFIAALKAQGKSKQEIQAEYNRKFGGM